MENGKRPIRDTVPKAFESEREARATRDDETRERFLTEAQKAVHAIWGKGKLVKMRHAHGMVVKS
jgi:hypothetical protein